MMSEIPELRKNKIGITCKNAIKMILNKIVDTETKQLSIQSQRTK